MRELNFLKQPDYAGFACIPDEAGHCTTCSDEAQSAAVLCIDLAAETALVVVDGQETEVDISLLELVSPGDILLVHGGVALSNQGQAQPKPTAQAAWQEQGQSQELKP
jgi:hydrogenase maturation factor